MDSKILDRPVDTHPNPDGADRYGYFAYENLSRLEDPEFTISAIITTHYPGATPAEVELEVTDRVEKAVQSMHQLKRIKEATSQFGTYCSGRNERRLR